MTAVARLVTLLGGMRWSADGFHTCACGRPAVLADPDTVRPGMREIWYCLACAPARVRRGGA